ncbi:hypothetical protein SADUNF_Sadunf05G0047900 [Salix dunnii]|uniref:Uncharacterized protein n=1 Tax=Salix dunnii TaxID=1413687 RepID=A0A835K2I2_9ROSI|nr:hypothetical protein SADUNF_Sadunf05G0047900 [Salix dunnii]
MSASIEALAMAGVDYLIHNMNIEEWEQDESELPPPHLLAEEEEEVERNSKDSLTVCDFPRPSTVKPFLCTKTNKEGTSSRIDLSSAIDTLTMFLL